MCLTNFASDFEIQLTVLIFTFLSMSIGKDIFN